MESWIQCDEKGCGWITRIEPELIPDWHNKSCPSCNTGVIVNDDDLAAWNMLMAINHLNAAVDPNGEMERTTVVIDTAELRDAEEDQTND